MRVEDSAGVIVGLGIVAAIAYWWHSRWQARHVLSKLSGKGKKARKKAWKRLTDAERLVVEYHRLRMVRMLAVALAAGLIGALVLRRISLELRVGAPYWSGEVTPDRQPIRFWLVWLAGSLIAVGIWTFASRERRKLDRRAEAASPTLERSTFNSPQGS